MADRRPSFLRSLLSSTTPASRHRPTVRPSSPAPSSSPNSIVPTAEPTTSLPDKTPTRTTKSSSSATPPPRPQPSPPPRRKRQENQPKTSSQILASGSRRATQSRSLQVRSTSSSPSRTKATEPRSPARLPKGSITGSRKSVKPVSSPSKESRTPYHQQQEESHNKVTPISDLHKASHENTNAGSQPSVSSSIDHHASKINSSHANEKHKSPMQLHEKHNGIHQVMQEQPEFDKDIKDLKPKTVQTERQRKRTKEIRDDISNFIKQISFGNPKTDQHISVITLTGENKGASMQMGSSSSPIHIHRGYKMNPKDGDKTSEDDARSSDDHQPKKYVNNNAQGINNSIVFDSSITERNPGVHMVVSGVAKEAAMQADNV